MAVGSAHARKNKKPVVAQQQSPVVMTPEETLPWTTNEPGRRGAGLRWSLGRGARGAVASLYRVMCLPSEEGQVLWQGGLQPHGLEGNRRRPQQPLGEAMERCSISQ